MQLSHNTNTTFQPLKYTKTIYMLFFVSAFWGPALGGIPLGPVSLFPARAFAIAAWGLLALALAMHRPYAPLDRTFLSNYRYQIFFAVWLLWAGLSLVWTVDRVQGIRDLFNLFVVLSLAGMAPFFLSDKVQLHRAVKIWLTTFAIFMVMAVVENITTLHLPISRFSHGIQPHLSFRPTGVFINENNLATFISLSIPFLLTRWRYFTSRRVRISAGLGLFGGIYMLFVIGSRINWLVLIASVLIYSLFLTSKGKKLKVLAVLLLLVMGTYLFFALTQPTVQGIMAKQLNSLLASYLELLNPTGGQNLVSNNSIAIRINLVRNGALFLARTWGRGVGVGNFEAWIEKGSVYDTQDILNPHNWWIELATEYGVIITLGYLAFIGSLFWSVWKGWRRTRGKDKWIPEGISLALATFPLAAISPSSFLDYLPHWLLLALAMAWLNLHKAGE